MKRTVDWWLAALCGLVAVLVMTSLLTTYYTRRLNEDAFWVAHTHEVLDTLQEVATHAQAAQASQHRYIITGDQAFRSQAKANIDLVRQAIEHGRRLTQDNAEQQTRFPELENRIATLESVWSSTATVRDEQGFDAARQILLAGRSRAAMDDLQALLREMDRLERSLLRSRSDEREQTYSSALVAGLSLGAGAVAATIAFIVLLRRHFSARMAAATFIAEQGERLRTTLASIGDAVISTDTAGRITTINRMAEVLTGWRGDEAIGQPLISVFRIINENTRQTVEDPTTRALREGVIVGLANHTLLIAKDGAERCIDDSAAPIRCVAGQVVGCVLVFRDVSERRRLEKENAERHAATRLLASIVESSEDAIVSKSLDGTIQTWNAAAVRLFGYTAEQAIGRHISLLIPADRADEEDKIISRIRSGERVEHFDTVRMRRDGERVEVSLTISPIRDETGQVIGASKIARDISQRKQMEGELRRVAADLAEADRRKDEFLATLAHELRNPLAPLRNALSILDIADGDAQAMGQAREMMQRQISQMVRLIDDLLDVSRISRGKLELRTEVIELAPIVKHAVEACRSMADSADKQITVELPPQPVYVNADAIRLTQVFGNLFNNACKFTKNDGRISLTVERQDDDVMATMKDNGIGIPADKLDSIFDMFSQVDRSLEKSQDGLGIGLTLVKRLVEMHGGAIAARSDGLGKGSEFIVRLPAASGPPSASDEPAEKAVSSGPRRILVVDDNRDSAESLAMLLRLSGNETHLAYDGEEAVEAVANHRPHVVLLDLGLPRLNGYEACRRIRQQPWSETLIIIALTGWGQEEDRRKSSEAGFDGHFVKPVDHAALMKLLAELQPTPE